MEQNILGLSSFELFLNSKKIKHKLVHVYEQRECCDCVSDKIKGERLIAKEQLLVLYKSDETKRIQSHKKYSSGRLAKVCICNYCAKENIDVKVVDITLANYIIKNVERRKRDTKTLEDDEFGRKWEILQRSILGIANLIDNEYVDLQRIHVPAFLQLNVPNSWDETRIFEYLQDMRLSGTSDAHIRIMAVSRDDLHMYTKIAKTVLNVDSLKREINTILSGMLSAVAIDTTQRAEVSVNLTISGKIGNTRAEMIIEHVTTPSTIRTAAYDEKMKTIFDRVLAELRQKLNIKEEGKHSNFSEEQPSMTYEPNEENSKTKNKLSAIRVGETNTRAEIVEEYSEMSSEDVVEEPENRSAIRDWKTNTRAEFVDMVPTAKTNYFKLVALIVDTACQVIWAYIRTKILGSSRFESFLNLIKEKHKLIHLFETNECCECVSELIKGERLISRKQLLLLYQSFESKQIQNHTKYVGRKVVRVCICKYVAIQNIDVKIIDITLANYVIRKCGKQELGLDSWMTQIKEVRNEIFHISDIQEITDDKFGRKWKK
ncbi:unnamed protein product [Mytilus coruscus]|uniref:Uncharacterized protein n=1 Tax=Mytilus coruscus TaxID=42192 RepID=A0A6J8CAE1_MYTCO|nr:unnamed protein product [Mytilus coruscus]